MGKQVILPKYRVMQKMALMPMLSKPYTKKLMTLFESLFE